MNVTEYLEKLHALGVESHDLPVIEPLFQSRIWERMTPGDGPDRLADVIVQLRAEDSRFHVEGGSWTNNMSWVHGYDSVLIPMEKASSSFHEQMLVPRVDPNDPRYCNALFHLLMAETSCYRYWGQGIWTDYGVELARRANAIMSQAPLASRSSD
jgi:hypothetical protein